MHSDAISSAIIHKVLLAWGKEIDWFSAVHMDVPQFDLAALFGDISHPFAFLVINQNKCSTDGLPIMCNLILYFLSIPIVNAIQREREREKKDTRMKNSVIISTLQYKQLMI